MRATTYQGPAPVDKDSPSAARAASTVRAAAAAAAAKETARLKDVFDRNKAAEAASDPKSQ